ncbi:MAG: hypothetical protein K2N25_04905 [Muribaculaceae bacterium]|nr:hypothetical protein [Muribaculaceae bacterium]
MRKITTLLALFSAIVLTVTAKALEKTAKEQLYEQYDTELETATTARDSIRILYNMFDLSARKGQLLHGWQILDISERAGDINAKIDMLRTLGTFYPGDDSIVGVLLKRTEEIPNEASRASTRTYILNQYFMRKNRQADNPMVQEMLLDSIMKSHNLNDRDIYDELSVIYQILMFLGVDAEGVLFRESLETYEELIRQLPMSDYPLKSQFNTTSAMIHSRLNGNPRKAVEADREMLDLIGQLQQMYRKQNRKYRNYDVNKFISYRRMLSNYEGLTPEEVEEIHDSLLAICSRDPDVQNTIKRDGDPSGFYYMARKDYAKAVPLLKNMFDGPYLTPYQSQQYYKMLMEASKAIGDRDTYVHAMEQFIHNTMVIDSIKSYAIKKEIMVRDSILPTPLLSNVANRHIKNTRPAGHNDKTFMIFSAVLALLLITYMVLYFRLRMKQSGR